MPKRRIQLAFLGCLAGALLFALPQVANADPITLTVLSGPALQQIQNRPCVIGDPSCHNPTDFQMTLIPPNDSDDTLSSPNYTVQQLRSMVGDSFWIGVDINQAPGHNDGVYDLVRFTMSVDGTVQASTASPTLITPINPGNGYSDAHIIGFNLAGLPGTALIGFTTTFTEGAAGREQYFLHAASTTGSESPEPASILLLGSGLALAFRYSRRQKAASV